MVLAKLFRPGTGSRLQDNAGAMSHPYNDLTSTAEAAFSQPQWPFDVALQEDLRSGAINEMLGVTGPLKARDVSHTTDNDDLLLPDDHSYFFIRDLRMLPERTEAMLSFLVRDRKGYGRLKSRELSLPAKADDAPKTRFHAIDKEALKIRQKYADGEGLYRNHVRQVLFESGTRLYSAYFKYTPAYEAEVRGREFTAAVGASVPTMHASAAPNSFWMPSIEGVCLRSLLYYREPKAKKLSDYFGATEANRLKLMQIGAVMAYMFIFGNDDLHAENVILGDKKTGCLDFECFGLPFPSDTIGEVAPERSFTKRMNESLTRLFWYGDTPVLLNIDVLPYLVLGFKKAVSIMSSLAPEIDRGLLSVGQTFGARLVIRPTIYYISGYAMFSGLPHYTMSVPEGAFVNTILTRLEMARAALERSDLVWDTLPSVYFKHS